MLAESHEKENPAEESGRASPKVITRTSRSLQEIIQENPEAPEDDILLRWLEEVFYDPLGFVLDAFDWGRGELAKWGGPDTWQSEFLYDFGQELRRAETEGSPVKMATASGHGIGKSTTTSWVTLFYLATRPNSIIRVTANTEVQLFSTTWREIGLWLDRLICKHWFTFGKTKLAHNANPRAWYAQAVAWSENNPDAFAGLHSEYIMLLFDEASGIAPSIWEAAIGALTTPGAVHLAFGNPLRPSGDFFECFKNRQLGWKTRNIDSRTAAAANKKYLQQLVDAYGEESDVVKRRVRGVFPSHGAAQLISRDTVELAQKRTLDIQDYSEFPKFLGVDVARFGDDKSAFVLRQGPKLLEIRTVEQRDTEQVADIVLGILARDPDIQMAYIDEIGIGASVVDKVGRYDERITGVNVSRRPMNTRSYLNVRIEVWDKMRKWLESADIPDNGELADELCSPEYDYVDRTGVMYLESKRDMIKRLNRSPDIADALALTFARPEGAEYGFLGEEDDIFNQRWSASPGRGDSGRNRVTGY